MTTIKSLLLKSIPNLFILTSFTGIAMEQKKGDPIFAFDTNSKRFYFVNNNDNPDLFQGTQLDPNEKFNPGIYEEKIKEQLEKEKETLSGTYRYNKNTTRFYFPNPADNYDLNPDQLSSKEFQSKGINSQKQFDQDKYRDYINKRNHMHKKLVEDTQKTNEAAEQEKIKKEKEYDLERIKAGTPEQHSQYAAPLLGSESDKAQGEAFKAQARFHEKQANSLKYNNYYIVASDMAGLAAQMIAPSLSPALSPVLLELRQKVYKTAAEKDAEKTRNACDIAVIKETEARELAAIANSLYHGSGQVQKGKGLEEVIEAAHRLARVNNDALKDLEKRQKETSDLNEQLKKRN